MPKSHSSKPYTVFAASCNGRGKPVIATGDDIPALLGGVEHVSWIHIVAHDPLETAEILIKKCGLPALEVHSALSARDRAELHDNNELLYLEVPVVVEEAEDDRYPMLAMFLTRKYLLSVSREKLDCVDDRIQQWLTQTIPADETSAGILHGLLDTVIDRYFPVSDDIQNVLDDLEDQVYAPGSQVDVRSALRLKKRLLNFRRRVAPLRDACNALLRRDNDLIPNSLWPHFHDHFDRTLRIVETVDLNRDILTSILDAHLSIVSNRLNEVMRLLTVISTVLMSVTLISSIYGMNFQHMPETRTTWGYPAALVFMVLVGVMQYWFFKRKNWL